MPYRDKEKTNVYLDRSTMMRLRAAAQAAGMKLTPYIAMLLERALEAGW